MAMLKINSNDLSKLEEGKLVIASDDINLTIMYRDFPEGKVSFKTVVGEDPLKIIVFVAPGNKGPDFTCGGAEIVLSKNSD